MNPLRRIKRLWQLSNYELREPNAHAFVPDHDNAIDGQIVPGSMYRVPIGDGKAVFLSDMTEAELEEFVHQEERGWRKFVEKFFGKQ